MLELVAIYTLDLVTSQLGKWQEELLVLGSTGRGSCILAAHLGNSSDIRLGCHGTVSLMAFMFA
tara:strand:+ start:71 stop:262 length:192 start_codon:yes stop_codon:yes gene_type:complete